MGQLGYLNIVDMRSLTCPKCSNLAHKSFKRIITFPTVYTLHLAFFIIKWCNLRSIFDRYSVSLYCKSIRWILCKHLQPFALNNLALFIFIVFCFVFCFVFVLFCFFIFPWSKTLGKLHRMQLYKAMHIS